MKEEKNNTKCSEYRITQDFFANTNDNNEIVLKLHKLINEKTFNDMVKIINDNFDILKNDENLLKKFKRIKNNIKTDFIYNNKTIDFSSFRCTGITKEDYINIFCFLKILFFLDKHKQCEFKKGDGFWTVSNKKAGDGNEKMDFYFYSFDREIESFLPDTASSNISVKKELILDKKTNKEKEICRSVSSFCVNKDENAILTTHYRGDTPQQCFNIGCNFILDENKPLSHDNYAFGSEGNERKAEPKLAWRFTTRNKNHIIGSNCIPNKIVTENLSLGRICGISDIETILSIRFHKQSNVGKPSSFTNPPKSINSLNYFDKLKIKNYDETILGIPEGKDEYKVHDFCFSFEPTFFRELRKNEQKEMLKKMKDQISKVVKANNKLGVKQINIIDYENKPSFIKIPNDIKCVQEYLDARIEGKNFDNERIEQMNDDKEIVLLRDKLQYPSDEVLHKKQKSCLTPWEELSTGGKFWRSIWTLGFGTPLFNCCSCSNSVRTKD